MMASTHITPPIHRHGLSPSSLATKRDSSASQRYPYPICQPSTKALILQQKHQEEQQRSVLPRADTTDDALLCRATTGVAPHLSSKEEAAALRERSNSLAVLESMRSHLPGNGHTMSAKVTAKLKKEMDNAVQVMETFLSPKLLRDQSIPHELLAEAYGLVFITMYKAGFLFSGKIGTGFIILRTTGGWSAPNFLTSGGFGFGMMAGGEVVNYMIILNSRNAVKVFTRNGQVQLGSELDITVGPIGRATRAALNFGLGGVAPNYSYSHSKGLYGGIGLSSGVICTRKSLNAKCYGPHVTVRQLLGGEVACPLAVPLWRALDKALGMQREYVNGSPALAPTHTGMACDACGHVHSSGNNPNACVNCGNLLVYSVSMHSGRRNTSQFIASTSMSNPAASSCDILVQYRPLSVMETLTPRISEVYGASGGVFRVGEEDSYIQDLDELERDERALENTVQELVNRRAAVPIGVKFHREGAASSIQQEVAAASEMFRGSEAPQKSEDPLMRSRASAEEEEENEEEDEMMDEDDDEDEDEDEETTGRATIVRGEGRQSEEDSFASDIESSDDSFAREIESDDDPDLPPPRD